MAKTLLEEIKNQLFGTHKKPSGDHRPKHLDYEKAQDKLRQAAFENKKAYEIMKHKAKSKGWV
jgi:hypothetical protein